MATLCLQPQNFLIVGGEVLNDDKSAVDNGMSVNARCFITAVYILNKNLKGDLTNGYFKKST